MTEDPTNLENPSPASSAPDGQGAADALADVGAPDPLSADLEELLALSQITRKIENDPDDELVGRLEGRSEATKSSLVLRELLGNTTDTTAFAALKRVISQRTKRPPVSEQMRSELPVLINDLAPEPACITARFEHLWEEPNKVKLDPEAERERYVISCIFAHTRLLCEQYLRATDRLVTTTVAGSRVVITDRQASGLQYRAWMMLVVKPEVRDDLLEWAKRDAISGELEELEDLRDWVGVYKAKTPRERHRAVHEADRKDESVRELASRLEVDRGVVERAREKTRQLKTKETSQNGISDVQNQAETPIYEGAIMIDAAPATSADIADLGHHLDRRLDRIEANVNAVLDRALRSYELDLDALANELDDTLDE